MQNGNSFVNQIISEEPVASLVLLVAILGTVFDKLILETLLRGEILLR